ncbi:MAG: aminoacyl-tRNA hydrolase [Lacibacter sp.]
MKFLIVGLGNIGDEYAHTRHNIGFDVVQAFIQQHGGSWRTDRLASVAEVKFKGRTVICIQPTTYMNLSGKALKYWMEKEKITLDHILVIVDELALPLNKLRLRPSGSHAGHNGLKNIETLLLTNAYPRLRFGIGNDYPKGKQIDFVLGKWSVTELPVVKRKIEVSVELIETFIFSGIDKAMNHYNKLEINI